MDAKHDFIIIGGGTSGLVVATRLTEDPNTSVLVLEAGGDHTADPRVQTPAMWPALLGSPDFDWDFRTVPQKGFDGKVIPLSQGKLLGGSSSINGQAFVANSKTAIDAWESFGNPGWNWETLAPYFKKTHTLSPPSQAATEHLRLKIDDAVRATDGPIQASFPEETKNPLPSAWVDTLAALGYPASSDPFTGSMTGGYVNSASINPVTRTRSSAAIAYLGPAKDRANLKIETEVLVDKIVFETGADGKPKAVGVQVHKKDGEPITVTANKEVIVAAGVFGTPKVLELSGIGSRAVLEKVGIPVVVENPNVGENLQDHPNIGLSFEVADGVKTLDGLNRQEPEAIQAAMTQYMTDKTGPFANSANCTAALIPLPEFVDGDEAEAKLKEFLDTYWDEKLIEGDFTPAHAAFVRSVLGKRTEATANIYSYEACGNFIPEGAGVDILQKARTDGNFLSLAAYLLFPLSRGSVHITSADPAEKPAIDPRYLEHPLDMELLVRHVQFVETIIRTEPLSKYLKPDGRRSYGAPKDLREGDSAKEYIKKGGLSAWHPTSSCAMLPRDKGGVVDAELGVHGVDNLRVVDASIMPLATRGNPQTTVYAVAERAADLIKARYSS